MSTGGKRDQNLGSGRRGAPLTEYARSVFGGERVMLVGYDPLPGLLSQAYGESEPILGLSAKLRCHAAAQEGMREGDLLARRHIQLDDF